jgi:hypothetical protein
MIVLGDSKSGKTSLCNALEDFHSQSNLIEQYQLGSSDHHELTESKLIEIHEFFMNTGNVEPNSKSSSVEDIPAASNTSVSRPQTAVRRESRRESTKITSTESKRMSMYGGFFL